MDVTEDAVSLVSHRLAPYMEEKLLIKAQGFDSQRSHTGGPFTAETQGYFELYMIMHKREKTKSTEVSVSF